MGREYLEKLKVKFLKAKDICAQKISTKELIIDGIPFTPVAISSPDITERGPLTAVTFPLFPEEPDTDLEFSGFFGLRAVHQQLLGCQNGIGVDQRVALQSLSVSVSIDNDLLKLQSLDSILLLGYVSNMTAFVYNTQTRVWERLSGSDLTPYILNRYPLKEPTEKIINFSQYVVLTNAERDDVIAKQNELVPTCQTIPIAGAPGVITAYLFLQGTLLEGPFEPLIQTQYSVVFPQ
jgi:hypothetical protein